MENKDPDSCEVIMSGELVIRLLGGVSVDLDGVPLRFATRKEVALLVYLACTGQPHTREAVAEQLWDERSLERARSNLRTLLSRLRHAVGPFLSLTREWVAFNPEAGRHWLDVSEFAAHLSAMHSWRGRAEDLPRVAAYRLVQALRLYRGDFLAGFHLRGATGFEEWAGMEREQLRCRAVEALHQLVSFYLRRGRYAEGITSATRLLALNPLDEGAYRQMMLLLAASGQRSAALAQYKTCQHILAQELGIEPSSETQSLYTQILTRGEATPAASGAFSWSRANNLPPEMTPLVGRREELGLLRQRLLDPSSRLVTVMGMGGVGKTRLALAVAEEVMGDFAHGVCFVPLTGVGSRHGQAGELLVQTIARALHMPFAPGGEPRAQLLGYLRQRELLLLLDDVEELFEAGSNLILEVLRSAPYVTMLVTSRQRLNLQAEHAVRIEGLAVPPRGATLAGWDGQSAYPYSSVQLFVEQAKRVEARFVLDRSNLPHVIEICHLAEGLPLGIELAASWVAEMDCAAIARSIKEGLDLLTTTRQDVAERHRSMRAVLEGSWQLLSPAEQRVLAQAAIFGGPFSQEAAVAVAGATPAELATLEEKSLLRRPTPGRYEMHALVRQFAGEKLALLLSTPADGTVPSTDAERELRARHSDYYLDLVTRHEAALAGSEPRQAAEQVQREMAEIQQAWRWAVEQGRGEAVLRSSSALARFLRLVGLYREGNDLFAWATEHFRALSAAEGASLFAKQVLARMFVEQAGFSITLGHYSQAADLARQGVELVQQDQDLAIEADGCARWGSALLLLGEYPAARSHLEHSLELARAVGFPGLEADSLRRLAILERDLGRYGAARAHLERALDLFQEAGDRDGAGMTLDNLGVVASDQVDYPAARAYFEQALPIFQETGYRLGQVSVLTNLGCLLIRLGDYDQAQAHVTQALDTLREVGGRMGEALLLNNLGNAAFYQGNYEAAYEYAQQAVVTARECEERVGEGYGLDLLGHVLAGLGQYQSAATAYLEALNIWEEMGQPNLAMESLAGLARTALATGDLPQAREHVARIMAYIAEAGGILGTDEDVLIYLTCYRVLHATADDRAQEVLAAAYHLVQERAAQIADEELRRSFLENVVVHREVVREWEAGHE